MSSNYINKKDFIKFQSDDINEHCSHGSVGYNNFNAQQVARNVILNNI